MKLIRAALRRLEHILIRAGIIATPEESEYYAWADSRLDELETELRLARKREANRSWNGRNH